MEIARLLQRKDKIWPPTVLGTLPDLKQWYLSVLRKNIVYVFHSFSWNKNKFHLLVSLSVIAISDVFISGMCLCINGVKYIKYLAARGVHL